MQYENCYYWFGKYLYRELIEGIINKQRTPVTELYLMDIDKRKLDIVGGLCERMIKHAGLNCRLFNNGL